MDFDDNHRDRVLRDGADPPFDPDPRAWESHCAGVKDMRHGAFTHVAEFKLADAWRCRYCFQWLKPPKGRT